MDASRSTKHRVSYSLNDLMQQTDREAEIAALNQRELRKLVISVRANANGLGLLLAICDDRNLQESLIQSYETELNRQDITPYRVRLDTRQPSLRATLENLVASKAAFRAGNPAVVTVLGGNELLGVRLTDDKSEQEKFFFSLQWTREALQGFNFPIVLWLSDTIATRLAKQAPDFWSWRSGVFEFTALPRIPETSTTPPNFIPQPLPETDDNRLSREELQQQIASLEQQNSRSPLLITLYNNLGEAYTKQYLYAEALEQYEKALALSETLKDNDGQARTLINLGISLSDCGRYTQAIDFYEQSLAIAREVGDRNGEAISLNNLGNAYSSLGQYEQAITFHEQALAIKREIGDRNGEANFLNNLGNSYHLLGLYDRAIDFYQQSLEAIRDIGNREGEAISLNNLGNAYSLLGQYDRSIAFYQQSLEIAQGIGDRKGEASSLNNLGTSYSSSGQYEQSLTFHQQSLAIAREIDDRNGEAQSLGNLGTIYGSLGQYEQAILFLEQSLSIARVVGDRKGEASSLGNLGIVYRFLGQYKQAITFYMQSLGIEREIGDRHGEASSLYNMGLTLARIDRYFEAKQHFEQALNIYRELKLEHEVEQCKQQIATCSQIIPLQRQAAPRIGEEAPVVPDWWEKSLPAVSAQRSKPSRRSIRQQQWFLWFVAGLAVVLLIAWLRSR